MLVSFNDVQLNENCKFTSAIDLERNEFARANLNEATPQQNPTPPYFLKIDLVHDQG